MYLPCGGQRQDAIRTKVFENYIRDHIDSWFALAQRENLDVQRMEGLILVSGCTLVSSWAAATFYDDTLDARTSLESIGLPNGGVDFRWGSDMVDPGVAHHNSSGPPDTVRFLGHINQTYVDLSLIGRGIYPEINAYSSGAFEQNAEYST